MTEDHQQSEFTLSELDVSVESDDEVAFGKEIQRIVADLRDNIVSEERVVDIIRDEESIHSDDSVEREDPEPFTKGRVIKPILEHLDYPYLSREAGDYADERGEQADYSVSLRDHSDISGQRMLIEAEPLNKGLEQDQHGLGQVRSWLRYRPFEADYGIATDGMRWVLIKYEESSHSFSPIADVDLRPLFNDVYENLSSRRDPVEDVLTEEHLQIVDDFLSIFHFDNFTTVATDLTNLIKETKRKITEDFYEEYIELVFGITDEESSGRDTDNCLVGNGVEVPHRASEEDRRLFSVELMNRLMFIKFLEDSEIVEDRLLRQLKKRHESGNHLSNFYNTYIQPLMYDVFNERPHLRRDEIRNQPELQQIPYLNGGLFRKNRENEEDYNVTDSILERIVSLLEEYQFSTTGGVGELDPSVLGTVFEKTINYLAGEQGRQKELGAYYTPDEVTLYAAQKNVQPLLLERLKKVLRDEWGWRKGETEQYGNLFNLIESLSEANADVPKSLLEEVNSFYVLDPACGSGHFLTSVLGEILAVREALWSKIPEQQETYLMKKNTVLNNLYGVDIVDSGVEITKLRCWLSIMSEMTQTDVDKLDEGELALPNVAFNIRQGNTLVGYNSTGRLREVDRESGTHQQPLSEINEKSITALVEERQEKVNEYKQKFGQAAEKLEDEIDCSDKEYNGRLNEKLLDDFRNEGVSIQETVNGIESPSHPTDHIHSLKLDLSNPISSADKDSLDDQFRDSKGLRINPGNGGYVSITMSHDYLNRTPDGRVDDMIDEVGSGNIGSVEYERYLVEEDLLESDFFHWTLEFYEVFDEEDGFDLVIGNPPYGIDVSEEEYALSDFPDTNHSSVVFISRAESLTRENGRITYVVPKPLTYADQWESAREDLLNKDLHSLIDLREAFEGVRQEQVVISLSSEQLDDDVTVGRREEGENGSTFVERDYDQMSFINECFFMWVNEENSSLYSKLGGYKTFEEREFADAIKGVDRFKDYLTGDPDDLLGYRGDDIKQFRFGSKSYLDPDIKNKGNFHLAAYGEQKVIFQRILAHVTNPTDQVIIQAAIDNDGACTTDTAIHAGSEDHSLELLCGLLNSNLFGWYAYNAIYNRAIRSMDLTPTYFSQFPAPPKSDDEIDQEAVEKIESAVEDITDATKADPGTIMSRFADLNEEVYELYDLSEKEIELIESEAPSYRETLVGG